MYVYDSENEINVDQKSIRPIQYFYAFNNIFLLTFSRYIFVLHNIYTIRNSY